MALGFPHEVYEGLKDNTPTTQQVLHRSLCDAAGSSCDLQREEQEHQVRKVTPKFW